MQLLLDTHAALWWAQDPAQLSAPAAAAIADGANAVWFTAASAWELAIKVRSGKVTVDVARLVAVLVQDGVHVLGIGVHDGIAAGSLAWSHRDPFDRMIVAQAERLDLVVVSRDQPIRQFLGDRCLEA